MNGTFLHACGARRALFILGSVASLACALAACDSAPSNSPSSASSGATATGTGGGGGMGGSYPAPYTLNVFDSVRITSDSNDANFQNATALIDFHDAPFASVKMIIDLESTCYPFEKWMSNPPPAGQNWPADCDAFDRNFEFTLDDPADPMTDPPAIELLRAITPFGGPLHAEVDITDVANGLPGQHNLRTHISTWSDGSGMVTGSNGGWNVTARIEVTPGAAPRHVLAVLPLFNGSQNTLASPDPISFTVPDGTTSSRLEFRATGHGGGMIMPGSGCIGPAEEFCQRTFAFFADSQEIEQIVAWRDDCDTLCTVTHSDVFNIDYCLENPCGAIQSVRASRANWCPGSVTPPFEWNAAALNMPGPHTFNWTISQFIDGGVWRLSAHYIAFGD